MPCLSINYKFLEVFSSFLWYPPQHSAHSVRNTANIQEKIVALKCHLVLCCLQKSSLKNMRIYSLTFEKKLRITAKMSTVIPINQCTQLFQKKKKKSKNNLYSWSTTAKYILIPHDVSSTNNSSSRCHVNTEELAHQ